MNLAERFGSIQEHTFGASWVTAEELAAIPREELAERRDERVHEYRVSSAGEDLVTPWLKKPGHEDLRAALASAEEVRRGDRALGRGLHPHQPSLYPAWAPPNPASVRTREAHRVPASGLSSLRSAVTRTPSRSSARARETKS